MNLLLTLQVAARALGRNKLRAVLTEVGVRTGIADMLTTVSIGESATALVRGSLQGLGTNVIFILPSSSRAAVRETAVPTLVASDSDAIAEECPAILATSPLVFTAGQVIYGNSNWKPKELF